MVNGALIVTILLSVALLLLGLVAVLRNAHEALNRRFFVFAASVSAWLVTNYLAGTPRVNHGVSLVTNKLVLIAGSLSIVAFLGFMLRLAQWQHGNVWWRGLIVLNSISFVLCLTPSVVADVSFKDDQVVNSFGSLSMIYFAILAATALTLAITIVAGHFRLVGVRRAQFDATAKSGLVVIPIILIGNALLPVLGFYGLVNITPLSVSIIVATVFYVITKHRLFNVRPAIIRSLAYVLSLGIILMGYGLAIHYISVLFERQYGSQLWNDFANVVLIMVALVAYGPLKAAFEKATNSLFYKDAYNPQEFLGELNRVIINTVDVERLLMEAVEVINRYIKSESAAFILNKTNYEAQRTIGILPMRIEMSDLQIICKAPTTLHQRVVTNDDLENRAALHDLFVKYDVSLVARLSTTQRVKDEGLGYIVLGHKKSGNPYTRQDVDMMRIISGELVIAIQNALRFEEIENFAATLQDRVDEATRKLRRTNEKLRQLDEAKDDFVSMASHQLRTPLTSIKGYTSMVLEGDAGKINATQRELLQQAFFSSQRMVYLIADLLNVSRLKTGKFVIEAAQVNLAEIVEQEISQLKETAAGRKLTLTYNKPDNFPTLTLDETKTRQVIMNFADNAIYYTPAGGHIDVMLEETPTSVSFKVVDDGIGVPKHEQPHLFTKFYRAGNARKARPDGTGLGLFMAKKVIVGEGGAIIFQTEEGKGSTFGFTFPKKQRKIPAPEVGQPTK